MKSFFGYRKYDSMTVAFLLLMPSLETVLHDAQYSFIRIVLFPKLLAVKTKD